MFCGYFRMMYVRWISVATAVAVLPARPERSTPACPRYSPRVYLAVGFQESVAFSGLTNPMVVRFASDGRVFVAEKAGLIKVFDNLSDQTPTQFADLFDERPQLLGSRPSWHGARTRTSRRRPTSTSSTRTTTSSARKVRPRSGRRLLARPPAPRRTVVSLVPASPGFRRGERHDGLGAGTGRGLVPAIPEPLGGTVEFGPDGALYASAGDGASFTFVDYGQAGSPHEPLRRSACARWRRTDTADRRGRSPTQPGSPHTRRTRPLSTEPSSAWTP